MSVRGLRSLLVLVISLLTDSGLVNSVPYTPRGNSCGAVTNYYETNLKLCCRRCPPGYYAEHRCTRSLDTSCQPCPPGEFTEFWNYVLKCKLCPDCDRRRGLEVSVNCSTTVKTRCQCESGTHCEGGSDCTDCERHTLCRPGQQLAEAGTPTHDTKCTVCPPGTFQKEETLEKCKRHKNCSAHQLVEVQVGTAVSDAVCEDPQPDRTDVSSTPAVWSPPKHLDPTPDNPYLLITVVTMCFLCLCALLGGLAMYIRTRRRKAGRKASTNTQPPTDIDRTSLESKQPLLQNKQASPLPQRALPSSGTGGPGCEEAQAHLGSGDSLGWPDGDCWSQTSGRDRGVKGTPVGAEAPAPGGHGLLGLNGCHVRSLESNVTVNGPLYIYNGPPCAGPPPPTQHQEYHRGNCCQETGSVPARGPVPEESGHAPARGPVPEESGRAPAVPQQDSGVTTRAVQERSSALDDGRGETRLVVAQQEAGGKDSRLPAREERPI